MDDRQRRDVALFRYSLIRDAADAALSPGERGRLVRDLAAREHRGPDGTPVRVGRATLDRWIRAWRARGFDALMPKPKASVLRTPAEILDLAVALKREAPARTGAQIRELILAANGWAPHERTIQRHLAREGLNRYQPGAKRVFGRFEAENPNDLWTGDVLHGPRLSGRKTYLFAFIDDCSRLLVGYRWAQREDQFALEATLRAALGSRGTPAAAYVDNGAPFVSRRFLRALGVLGIRIVHSRPGEPAGRGKIERFFRTVRTQFLVEVETKDLTDVTLGDLNRWFEAWVEKVYHHRTHTETGEEPLLRFHVDIDIEHRQPPAPHLLREAFLWSETRQVAKTATIRVHGNVYEVDPLLVGATIEVLFDPYDLTRLEVRYQDRPMGEATPHEIGRWTRHPDTPQPDTDDEREPTGIDYVELIADSHDKDRHNRINYDQLTLDTNTDPDSDEDQK